MCSDNCTGGPFTECRGTTGHTSGHRTTERYAKVKPEGLDLARQATEDYFEDLRRELGQDA